MGEAAPAPLRGADPHPALLATFSRERGRREARSGCAAMGGAVTAYGCRGGHET
jgi:hypothetical protein